MPRKPNYQFERRERDRLKAAKKAEKREQRERERAERNPNPDSAPAGNETPSES